jgi:hypothetical protein
MRNHRVLGLLASIFALFSFSPISAATSGEAGAGLPAIAELLPEGTTAEIASAGKVTRVSQEASLALLPRDQASGELRSSLEAQKPSVVVEALFVLKRPAPADASAELAAIYGLLRSVGSLEGIQYWSASRKAWRTFYAESYRIDGPETKKRLPDLPAPTPPLPASETLYAFQRDLSFGSNVYRYDFKAFSGSVSLEQRNLTKMSYGLLPVLGEQGLSTRILVIQAKDGLLFYALSSAQTPSVSMLRGKLQDSFGNRAEALFKWFSQAFSARTK